MKVGFNFLNLLNHCIEFHENVGTRKSFILTCARGDNDLCSNSKVQRITTKQAQSEHGSLKKIEVGSGGGSILS